ncbi:MAG: hypothetical protein EA422_14075 [Gemmatimonadales bacterium]|nr:MAG: hypothetical protein EA422_14075 [Gemmatimonadales bacterium]
MPEVRDALLVVWVALLGATRVDLLAGAGPFLLTPFLLLSPLVLASELLRVAQQGWEIRLPAGAGSFTVAVSVLLALLVVSAFFSIEPAASARRVSLLVVQVGFVVAIGYAIALRPDPARILVRGAVLALGLTVAVNAAQLALWFQDELWPRPLSLVISLEPGNYFGVIPRLTGLSHDPNLGGLLTLGYLALIQILSPPEHPRSRWVAVGVVMVVLTLSRSAVLAALVYGALRWGAGRQVRITPGSVGALGAMVAAATAAILLSPGFWDGLVGVAEILGTRLTPDEGSASEHAILFARGIQVATESVKQALVGVGYGAGYVLVQDIFPGNEYGNFHSLFITFFAEAGTPALLVSVAIFVHLLLREGPYRPLIGALVVFNLFQQAHTEPNLWLILLLAWSGVAVVPASPASAGSPSFSSPSSDAASFSSVSRTRTGR